MSETFKAVVIDEVDGKPQGAVKAITLADLPDHEVLVQVAYSTLNYKDGLNVTGSGRIARRLPMIAGADLAGTVLESKDPAFKPGDAVIVNGWGMSETTGGGYTRYQRVKAEWLTRLPAAFSLKQAMAIGTAGYTAALSVVALERWGRIQPGDGEVLVTGAAGGVGSVSVALLARRGFRVTAATGRPIPMTICSASAPPASWSAPPLPKRAGRCRRSAGRAPSTASAPPRSPMFSPRPCAMARWRPVALPAARIFRPPSCRISCAAWR